MIHLLVNLNSLLYFVVQKHCISQPSQAELETNINEENMTLEMFWKFLRGQTMFFWQKVTATQLPEEPQPNREEEPLLRGSSQLPTLGI